MATVTAPPVSSAAGGPAVRVPGARLGRYELVCPIASGGMAEVWVARQWGDFGFARTVALKLMRRELSEDPKFHAMFLEEARIALRVRARHVVAIHDLGEADGVVYQALELVEGAALSTLVQRSRDDGGVPRAVAIRIFLDVLEGLDAAHELRDADGSALHVIHRDVSPQNVLVGVDGDAKVTDFGVAKVLGRLTVETDAGQFKGKYTYCSPEQLARASLDRRSDVCSAGIVLWELLAHARLFQRSDLVETIEAVRAWKVPSLSDVAPSVPPEVAQVCMRALAREPSDRFDTAGDFARALLAAAERTGDVADRATVRAFVLRFAGKDIDGRAAAVKDAITLLTAPPTRTEIPIEVQSVASPSSTPKAQRRRPIVLGVIALGCVLVAGAVGGRRLLRDSESSAERAAAAPPDARPRASAPKATDDPMTASASVSATARPSPPVSVPTTPATKSPPRQPVGKASTSAAPAASLPFRNPY